MRLAMILTACMLFFSVIAFCVFSTLLYSRVRKIGLRPTLSKISVPFYIVWFYRRNIRVEDNRCESMIRAIEATQWIVLALVPIFIVLLLRVRTH